MEYKKGKGKVESRLELLYSKLSKLILSIFGGVVGSLLGIMVSNPLVGLLIGILIILGLIIIFIDNK